MRDIWKVHELSPHRWRQVKLSNDRAFAEKLRDVVGLYVVPPAHAVVLSVDEKAQIQALDRTQPGLPLKRGRGPTMTDDYKRNATTTLFAALDVLDGSVIPCRQGTQCIAERGQNMQRHRHQEFIRPQPDRAGRPRGQRHPRHRRQVFSPGIWWIGVTMNRCGSEVQTLQTYS